MLIWYFSFYFLKIFCPCASSGSCIEFIWLACWLFQINRLTFPNQLLAFPNQLLGWQGAFPSCLQGLGFSKPLCWCCGWAPSTHVFQGIHPLHQQSSCTHLHTSCASGMKCRLGKFPGPTEHTPGRSSCGHRRLPELLPARQNCICHLTQSWPKQSQSLSGPSRKAPGISPVLGPLLPWLHEVSSIEPHACWNKIFEDCRPMTFCWLWLGIRWDGGVACLIKRSTRRVMIKWSWWRWRFVWGKKLAQEAHPLMALPVPTVVPGFLFLPSKMEKLKNHQQRLLSGCDDVYVYKLTVYE